MKLSIIPEIVSERKIKFFDELDIPIEICSKSLYNYEKPFQPPYIIASTFARKTLKKEEIVNIDVEELKKLDYFVTVRPIKNGWFKGQQKIYLIEKKSSMVIPGHRKIDYIPKNHMLQKDIPNKRIRIVGPNAGPHGFGPWNEIK